VDRQDRPLKIGISCYPVYGGSGVVATELGIELAHRGHEVHFITYAQPFRLPYFMERIFYHEVEVPTYPLFEHPPYNLALSVAMHNVVESHDLDLIHAHYAVPHATSAWLAREMLERPDFRVVTTLHGTDITLIGQDPSYRPITRFSIHRADGVSTVSEYLKRETIEHFGMPEAGVRAIPNFVDLDRYSRSAYPCHRSKFAPAGEKIVMHISNFRPVKRVDEVVRIFARINRKVPARLLLVGDGPDRGKAQQAAEQEGVLDQVLFLGKQNSVAELLSCSDLFLLPSEQEAFGLVALEAMACGVPVVATRTGGIPEVVEHGRSGYLAEVGAVEEMAEAGIALLADPDRWTAASREARTAAERFSAERIVTLYEDWYKEILAS
jgi:L-malate glycosyltransferase